MNRRCMTLSLVVCLAGTNALALDLPTELHGFVTVAGTASDTALNPLDLNGTSQDGQVGKKVSFVNDSRFGLQITARPGASVQLTTQLLARAKQENYDLFVDWAYLALKLNEIAMLRAGKVKHPTFLISDYFEVGHAYPWIRPPEEVYASNPISTIHGVDLLLKPKLGSLTLLIQPYYGTSKGESELVPQELLPMMGFPPGTITHLGFTADRMLGVNLSLGNESFTVRAGYLGTLVSVPSLVCPAGGTFGPITCTPNSLLVRDDRAEHASVSATLDWRNLVLFTEYFEREISGFANSAFPNQRGAYLTLGRRMGKWLPHLTHARLRDNHNPVTSPGQPLLQDSVTAGVRYEMDAAVAIKAEIQQISPLENPAGLPTRGLLVAPPPGGDVMIYSLAVESVF